MSSFRDLILNDNFDFKSEYEKLSEEFASLHMSYKMQIQHDCFLNEELKHQKKVIDRLSRKIQKLNKKLNDIHLSITEVCVNCPMREKCLENECRAFQIEQIIVGDPNV